MEVIYNGVNVTHRVVVVFYHDNVIGCEVMIFDVAVMTSAVVVIICDLTERYMGL